MAAIGTCFGRTVSDTPARVIVRLSRTVSAHTLRANYTNYERKQTHTNTALHICTYDGRLSKDNVAAAARRLSL